MTGAAFRPSRPRSSCPPLPCVRGAAAKASLEASMGAGAWHPCGGLVACLDAGALDHRRPMGNLGPHHGVEFGGRTADDVEPKLSQALAHVRQRQRTYGVVVDLV